MLNRLHRWQHRMLSGLFGLPEHDAAHPWPHRHPPVAAHHAHHAHHTHHTHHARHTGTRLAASHQPQVVQRWHAPREPRVLIGWQRSIGSAFARLFAQRDAR